MKVWHRAIDFADYAISLTEELDLNRKYEVESSKLKVQSTKPFELSPFTFELQRFHLSPFNFPPFKLLFIMDFAFKELKVWHRAIDFAEYAISLTEELDSNRKYYRLIEQLESCSTSVAMNIAEGKGRNSKKEFIHFLYIARGSVYETVTLAVIFARKKWITREQLEKLESEALEIASMIKGLINSIDKSL